jgi:hypothetical protein
VDEWEEAVCGLVIAGGDTASVFELVEEAFDAITQSAEQRIDGTRDLAISRMASLS